MAKKRSSRAAKRGYSGTKIRPQNEGERERTKRKARKSDSTQIGKKPDGWYEEARSASTVLNLLIDDLLLAYPQVVDNPYHVLSQLIPTKVRFISMTKIHL